MLACAWTLTCEWSQDQARANSHAHANKAKLQLHGSGKLKYMASLGLQATELSCKQLYMKVVSVLFTQLLR